MLSSFYMHSLMEEENDQAFDTNVDLSDINPLVSIESMYQGYKH